jgi:dihydrofolate reductase
MKTQYYTASTLNGFLADPNDSLEWLMQFGEVESMKNHYPNFIAQVGALVMGAKTYEWVYNHENLKEHPEKWFYSLPTWVMTHRDLPAVAGADIRFTSMPIADLHAEMARVAKGKNIWLVGGGELVGQFLDHQLLDEIIVTFAPVLLSAGKPLLPRNRISPPLKLVRAETFGEVFATLTYAVEKE